MQFRLGDATHRRKLPRATGAHFQPPYNLLQCSYTTILVWLHIPISEPPSQSPITPIREYTVQEIDNEFYERADAHIHLSNSQITEDVGHGDDLLDIVRAFVLDLGETLKINPFS